MSHQFRPASTSSRPKGQRLSRRAFTTAATGAAVLTGARHTFPSTPASAQTPIPYATPAGNDLVEEASIASLRRGLDDGEFTVSELVAASLARIEALDADGPGLNAMIELNPEAMEIAERRGEEISHGINRGPLHGIPIVVKDIFATADAMRTTAGSLALAENEVSRDAFVIEQLRNAGMVILGKTNMSEWSNFRGTVVSGWSSRGGQTVNPYATSHTAWGSSTGSAVAVAASYAPVGLGAETDGSIICPASACGVVGLKPTVGLVSRQGTIGISFTQDSPGPIGRSVEDVAYLLEVIAGYDPEDMAYGEMAEYAPAAAFAEFPVPDAGERSYVKMLSADGLQGIRVGVVRSLFGFDPETDVHVDEAIRAMEDAGAEIVEDVQFGSLQDVYDGWGEGFVLGTEFTHGLHRFFEQYMPYGPISTIQDVVDYYWTHQDETQFWGDVADGLLEASWVSPDAIYDPGYLEQLANNLMLTRDLGIDQVMDEHELDVLVAPSAGLPTVVDGGTFLGSTTKFPAMAGYPSLTLPVGYSRGLPAGMHMFGRAFSERKILRYAYALEKALNVRQPPEYLDTVPEPEGTAVPEW